jgi:hypothetical protein
VTADDSTAKIQMFPMLQCSLVFIKSLVPVKGW